LELIKPILKATPTPMPSPTPAMSNELVGFWFIILFLVGVFFYFVPTMIGIRKKNATAIAVLNIFAGWTFIGWVVALVWACSED
jgi:hypothetical protein